MPDHFLPLIRCMCELLDLAQPSVGIIDMLCNRSGIPDLPIVKTREIPQSHAVGKPSGLEGAGDLW